MLAWIFKTLGKLRRDDKGGVTVEFVIVFPVFMSLFISVFESGLMMTKVMMLERGLDLTVRQIRLAPSSTAITHDAVKTMICDHALILADCEDNIQIEMVPIDATTFTMPGRNSQCIDRESEVEPVVSFNAGGQNDIMFIRACVVVDPMFPNIGLGLVFTKDPSGGVRLISSSAFANEPI